MEYYICDNKSFFEWEIRIILPVLILLNVWDHIFRDEEAQESKGRCVGAIDDEKVGVEDDISATFLRIDCARWCENGDS